MAGTTLVWATGRPWSIGKKVAFMEIVAMAIAAISPPLKMIMALPREFRLRGAHAARSPADP